MTKPFEWDPQKARANFLKHGVSFPDARTVFDDPSAIEFEDRRQDYGEERFVVIGMAQGRLLTVAFAARGDAVRLISARAAEPFERRRYHET